MVLLALIVCLAPGCDKVDNKTVSGFQVRINLGTYALWNTYGVSGVGDYNMFNRGKGLPHNFPYNVNTYTGYGGVLLIMGLDSGTASYMPLAYDLACPVERDAGVTLSIDPDNLEAVCPKCKSRYNVLTGAGGPVSCPSMQRKVGLTTYVVRSTGSSGGYIITSY